MTTDETSPALRAVLGEKLGESLTEAIPSSDAPRAAWHGEPSRQGEEAGRLFPHAGKRLLTLTLDGAPHEVPSGVAVQPAYEWLLTR